MILSNRNLLFLTTTHLRFQVDRQAILNGVAHRSLGEERVRATINKFQADDTSLLVEKNTHLLITKENMVVIAIAIAPFK